MTTTDGNNTTPRAVKVPIAAAQLGIGVSLAWELVRQGKLRCVRANGRVIIPLSAIEEFLAGETEAAEGQSDD